jgi:hypothetical protein
VSKPPQSAMDTVAGTTADPARATTRIASTTRKRAPTTAVGETGIRRSRSIWSGRWFNWPVVIESVKSRNSTGAI